MSQTRLCTRIVSQMYDVLNCKYREVHGAAQSSSSVRCDGTGHPNGTRFPKLLMCGRCRSLCSVKASFQSVTDRCWYQKKHRVTVVGLLSKAPSHVCFWFALSASKITRLRKQHMIVPLSHSTYIMPLNYLSLSSLNLHLPPFIITQ